MWSADILNREQIRKTVGTWEHRAILRGNRGKRTPLGDPPNQTRLFEHACVA